MKVQDTAHEGYGSERLPNEGVEVVDAFRPVRRNLSVHCGWVLIVVGLLLSGTFLEATIFPAGTIVGTTRRAAALGVARMLLVGLGAYILIKRPRVTIVHLTAIALGGVLATLLGSALLQVAYVPPPVVSGWRAFAPRQEQNEFGFRGRRISYSPDDSVILLLGDSQVEAMAMAPENMPEKRLEAFLAARGYRAKVFSIGAGGYGQDQQLLALDEYFKKYRADYVVLWQTPGNDIWNNIFKTHLPGRNPKPTFWLDRAGRLFGPSEGLGEPLASSPIVVASLWQRAFGLPWRDKSWEMSLPDPYVPLTEYAGPVNTAWQERWDSNIGRMRDENLATEKSHLAVGLVPRSPRMQYGLDLTRALMLRIQDLVARQQGKLMVFQIQTRESAPEGDQTYVLNGKYYRVSNTQFQANWSYVNEGFDTEIVPVTVRDWRVSPEDGHLNAHATAQVMEDLADRLVTRMAPNPQPHQNPR
jgi:hypothetical protein